MQALVGAAREYLLAGLSVIALSGKQPNVQIHKRGLNQALSGRPESTEDDRVIETVFTHPETTGIGLVVPSHLVVVDVDGEEGARAWRELVGEVDLMPETPVAKTARGLHVWFLSPRPHRPTILGSKLDLKGPGGYVAAPPSLHPSGFVYEWLVPLVVDGMIRGMEWLPQFVEDLLLQRTKLDRYEVPVTHAAEGGSLKGLVRSVKHGEEGNRNHLLYWAACAARDSGFSLSEALDQLASASTLPSVEARRTVRSAYAGR